MAKPLLIEKFTWDVTRQKRNSKRDGLGMTALAASMDSSGTVWRPKIKKRDGLILVPSHRKVDILESFVCSYYEV